jgi:hypothetical protein
MPNISNDIANKLVPLKGLRQIISLGALLLVLAHIVWPILAIDFIALGLIVIAILPWLAPLVKSLELPGGWKVEFAEISKQIIEEKVPQAEKGRLTRHQVVSSHAWDGGYYKLYSNGIVTQRFKVTIIAGRDQTELTLPIAFPNEVIGVEVVGDLAVNITDLSPGGMRLRYQPQPSNMELTILVTGL